MIRNVYANIKLNMRTRKHKKGFTIIEIVLVLAIAGLIFAMVFVAIPALQRNERNAQRKRDMSRIMSAVIEYQKHNGGKNPFLPIDENTSTKALERFSKFIIRYIDPDCEVVTKPKRTFFVPTGCGSGFTDPDGTIYGVDARADTHTGGPTKKKEQIKFLDINSNNVGMTGVGVGSGKQKYIGTTTHLIIVFTKAKCAAEEGWVEWTSGNNDIGMWYPLEGGGVVCVDNQ